MRVHQGRMARVRQGCEEGRVRRVAPPSRSPIGTPIGLSGRGITYNMKVFTKNRIIDYELTHRSDTLAVFMSGLDGDMESPLLKKASKEFSKRGYSTIRFNFFTNEMKKFSFKVYLQTLRELLMSLKYQRYVFVGHSFGAIISILFLNKFKSYKNKSELIIWEPSLLPWKKEGLEDDFPGLNKTFTRELTTINTAKIFKSLKKKSCLIASSDSSGSYIRKYGEAFIIKKGGHLLLDPKVQKQLFAQTFDFLKTKASIIPSKF